MTTDKIPKEDSVSRKRPTFTDDDKSMMGDTTDKSKDESVSPTKRANTRVTETGISMTTNRYHLDNDGPFIVHLERNNVADSSRRVSAIFSGKILVRHWPHLDSNATKMKTLGASKFSLTFRDGKIANDFVEDFNKKKPCIVPNEE